MSRCSLPPARPPPRVFPGCAVPSSPPAGWWATALAVLLAAGCGPTHEQIVAFLRSNDAAVSTGHYTVNPPDGVGIHAPGAPEIDGVAQRVRPDGKVALRLLGEVHVAGLTTQEIAEKLRAQLSRYYIEPEVVVEVTQYWSQTYYVFGEVRNPGAKPYTGRDSLLRALAQASPTFLAWRSRIRVVRPAPDQDETKTIVVNLDEMIRTGNTDQNVLLQPGDIIEVPPTPLAWLGHRVRELLYPIEPAARAYVRPAEAVRAHETYEGSSDDDDDQGLLGR
jgi:polysaccharide export outer membrane protein